MKLVKIFIFLLSFVALIAFASSLKSKLQSKERSTLARKVNSYKVKTNIFESKVEDDEEDNFGFSAKLEKIKSDESMKKEKKVSKIDEKLKSKDKRVLLILHGIGDDCNNFDDYVTELTKDYSYDVVKCIEYGAGGSGFIGSLQKKAKNACKIMQNDKEISGNDVDVWALSLGGLIGRYIIQDCDFGGRVKKFISYGSPQSGVQLIPGCKIGQCGFSSFLSEALVYKKLTQLAFSPSNFFRVIGKDNKFKKHASFLPKINNLVKHDKNDQYKKNFSNLDLLVLVEFSQDTIVQPSVSARFGYYDDQKKLLEMRETPEYKDDLFGLQTLDKAGKIEEIVIDGGHLRASYRERVKVMDYLSPFV